MVDTVRSEAALLALLDQANSNISLGKSTIDRQVLRDLLVSIPSLGGVVAALLATNPNGPQIVDAAASILTANIRPNQSRLTTGLGSGGAEDLICAGNADTRWRIRGLQEQLLGEINNTTIVNFDFSVAAGETRMLVWDVDNNTLERVTVGVADSGGVGFKVLRIPN